MTSESQTIAHLLETSKFGNLLEGKKSVLDIGCKYGSELYPFLDLGFNKLVGTDKTSTSSKVIQFLKYKYKGYDLEAIKSEKGNKSFNLNHHNHDHVFKKYFPTYFKDFEKIEWLYGDDGNIYSLFLESFLFDVILVSDVLHFYSPDNDQTAINNILKYLKPNGICFIAVNTCQTVKNNWNQFEEVAICKNRKLYYKSDPNDEPFKHLFYPERIDFFSSHFGFWEEIYPKNFKLPSAKFICSKTKLNF